MKLSSFFARLTRQAPSLTQGGVHIEESGKIWIRLRNYPAPGDAAIWMPLGSLLNFIDGNRTFLAHKSWERTAGKTERRKHLETKARFECQLPGLRRIRDGVLDHVVDAIGGGLLKQCGLPARSHGQFAFELRQLMVSLGEDYDFARQNERNEFYDMCVNIFADVIQQIHKPEHIGIANANRKPALRVIQGGLVL